MTLYFQQTGTVMYCSADRLQHKLVPGKLRRLCAFSARCVENGRQLQLSKCYSSPEDHPPEADGGLAWVGQMLNREACDFNYSPTAVSLSHSRRRKVCVECKLVQWNIIVHETSWLNTRILSLFSNMLMHVLFAPQTTTKQNRASTDPSLTEYTEMNSHTQPLPDYFASLTWCPSDWPLEAHSKQNCLTPARYHRVINAVVYRGDLSTPRLLLPGGSSWAAIRVTDFPAGPGWPSLMLWC